MTNTTDPQNGKGVARGWSVQPTDPVHPRRDEVEDATGNPVAKAVPDSANEVSNVQLVLFGLFGGVYLLYTVGWFLIAQYFAEVNSFAAETSGTVGGVLQIVLFWAAGAAPLAWFATVVVMTRSSRPWMLPVGLTLGLGVLLPLPLFTVGAG